MSGLCILIPSRRRLPKLHELQSLALYIAPGDVELLEPAGVPEFPDNP